MDIPGATQLTETEWLATLVGDSGSGGAVISIAPPGWNTFDFLANPTTGTLPAAPANPLVGQIYIHTDDAGSDVVRIYIWKPEVESSIPGTIANTPGAWYNLTSSSDGFGGVMNLRKIAIPI